MKIPIYASVIILMFLLPKSLIAQALGYNNNRIAISADGNNQADFHPEARWPRADPDDWGGTPVALSLIAKLSKQDKLVHFSYNNFIAAPKHTSETNYMADGVNGAITRWNYDASRFFDVPENPETAIKHLASEISKSTAQDPLYFIHMGPSEFFYLSIKHVIENGNIEALNHVYVISHSGYNDNHLRRKSHHTMNQAIILSENRIKYKKIKDQNACNIPDKLWCSGTNFTPFHWMRDHNDEGIQWLYSRLHFHPDKRGADVSDAGMVYYLLLGDEDGNLTKLKSLFNNGILEKKKVEEKNGLLVFEAERFNIKGKWKLGFHSSASSGKFIYYDGANAYEKPDVKNKISYTFKINTPGNYTVKWVMRQPKDERGTDKGNDAYVYLSDDIGFAGSHNLTQYEKFYGRSQNDFVLNGVAEVKTDHKWLTAKFKKPGEYTINLIGRSHGLQIDRIVMFKDLTLEQVESQIKEITETSK
ncbi:hypothetical protein KFZ70_13255 [Tamlana fucoidanivorans]|uniref:Uncharacterized protein n=1 Tax=Allotamlana fucoidanivorans TaxID=2583814 RepID=A0A5C4SQN4_9FLAO|nr:hypothetical protein [Tamlana fucoidanivorans]TNJ46397.1 hypothetical protein FGF67_01880 [Tamlana fucoidanivorans]